MSPSTGMIADIFLAEIIPSGVARFLHVATRRSYPPKISTYRTWKKNESGKRRWWKGPKRGLHSPFRSLCKVTPLPAFSLLAFPTQMLSLCIRPNSISFRWRLPLRNDFQTARRSVWRNTNSGSQIYSFLIS